MIHVTYTTAGHHTHIAIRTGDVPGHRALAGTVTMEVRDADTFLSALQTFTAGGIEVEDEELHRGR